MACAWDTPFPQTLKKILHFHMAWWKHTETSASEGREELELLPYQGRTEVSQQLALVGVSQRLWIWESTWM